MSALHQLSKPANQTQRRPQVAPVRKQRTTPQTRRVQQTRQHRILALETSMKIAMNVLIAGIAVTSLCKVIPHRIAQQEKLQELNAEVKLTEQRVSQLKIDFNRSFDRGQERQIVQEQTHFTDPNRTPVVWLDKKGQATAQLPE
jgi:hypothetical protein